MKSRVPVVGNKVFLMTPIWGKTGIARVVKAMPDHLEIEADWLPGGHQTVQYEDVRRAVRADFEQ